jgi:glycosyltransferase involved in cell wall biosynthesis
VDQWPDVDRVLSEADLLVVDNSSCAFEMAAIGKPVVLLNLPSYRRDVEHGLRFWSHPPGIQVDHPSELADAICLALKDPPAHRAIRARAVAEAYAYVDGHASERAATAIMEALNGL